jgi:acetyltransferase-like isoleucine patch superfamily enzyme
MKQFFKVVMIVICLVLNFPLLLFTWLEKKINGGDGTFVAIGQCLSLLPGKLGSYMRAAYYFANFEKSSWEVHIGFGTYFSHRGASLGRHVAIGAYCIIGTADIGEGVVIASRVSIPSGKHQHLSESGKICAKPKFEKVKIGEKSWIGEGAIILADVGKNSVVSAGTVVIKKISEGCLVGGNPGRILKELNEVPVL